jgi:hypothetical protein
MTDGPPVDAESFERGVSAQLDADTATLQAQGQDFQQRVYAMNAMGQTVPPQMFSMYADGLANWIQYLGQARPAAEWLARSGRPLFGQRLKAIVDDLSKAVPIYRQMAHQQVAHLNGLASITNATNREINGIIAETNAARSAAFARQNALWRKTL